jgi:esterase
MINAIKKDDDHWCLNFPAASMRETMNSMTEEWAQLAGMSCSIPALFIRGQRSDYMKDDDKQIIKTVFPNSRIAGLDTGHWVHHERPDDFIKVTVDFLNVK